MNNLKYADYVHTSSDEAYLTLNSITDVRRSLKNEEYNWYYKIIPDLKSIDIQATIFSKKMVTEVTENNTLARVYKTKDFQVLIDKTREVYKYSYFKCLFYLQRMYEGGFNSKFISENTQSLVFIGHNCMYNTCASKHIRTTSMSSSTTCIKRLDVYQNDLKKSGLFEDPVYQQGLYDIDGEIVDFYNPELEFLLKDILAYFPQVKLVDLGSSGLNCGTDHYSNPLGNMCYSSDKVFIKSLKCTEMVHDNDSKYWNLANCIEIFDEDVLPSGDTIMLNISNIDLDKGTFKYMVHAITGLEVFLVRRDNNINPTPNDGQPLNGGNNSNPGGNPSKGGKPKGKPGGNKKNGGGKRLNNLGKNIASLYNSPTTSAIAQAALNFAQNKYTVNEVQSYLNNNQLC
jgi:hypothetical protein